MKYTKGEFDESLALRGLVIQQLPIESFLFDGELYSGDAHRLIDQYSITNPSDKFRTWLIKKGLRLETGTNVFKINTKMHEALKELITNCEDKEYSRAEVLGQILEMKSLLKEIEL